MARSAEVRNNFLCSSFQFRVVCCSMKLFSLNLFVFLVSRDEFPGAKLKVSSPVLFIFYRKEPALHFNTGTSALFDGSIEGACFSVWTFVPALITGDWLQQNLVGLVKYPPDLIARVRLVQIGLETDMVMSWWQPTREFPQLNHTIFKTLYSVLK